MEIKDLLNELGVRYVEEHRNVRHGWIGLDCPWCGTIGKYHLGISLEDKFASCWQCGYHSLPAVLVELSSLSYGEAKRRVGQVRGVGPQERPRTGSLRLPEGLGPLGAPHIAYLRSRGVDARIERFWGLRGIGLASRLAWRIFIPVVDRGETVTWTTRSIGDGGYVSARPDEEKVPIKHCLYGIDHMRHAAVVVEGPADAWRIGPGAVATFGINYTQEQVRRLAEIPIRAVCFDREPGAQRQARKLCRTLEAYPGRTERVELDADDPGSASEEEVSALRERFFGK